MVRSQSACRVPAPSEGRRCHRVIGNNQENDEKTCRRRCVRRLLTSGGQQQQQPLASGRRPAHRADGLIPPSPPSEWRQQFQ